MYVFSTLRKILKEKWGLWKEFPTSILNQKMELYVHTEYDRHSNNPTTLWNLLRSGSVMCKEHKGSDQLRMIQKLDGPLISGKHMFLGASLNKGSWVNQCLQQSQGGRKEPEFISLPPGRLWPTQKKKGFSPVHLSSEIDKEKLIRLGLKSESTHSST